MEAVSSPEPLAPSRRLRSAAEAERERLSRDLERLDARAHVLTAEIADVDRQREELREHLALLARISWEPGASAFRSQTSERQGHLRAVEPEGPPPKVVLRGARIRETAVLMLASSAKPLRPIHYMDWFKLLRDAGYGVDAQDPQAAFLTQITRSPVVRRADAPGTYALDPDAPRLLRDRLRALESKLAERAVQASEPDSVAQVREERQALVRELHATERRLEEALRVLGSPAPSSPSRAAS